MSSTSSPSPSSTNGWPREPFGGIASFSLHGWLWGVMAIVGTFVGLAFRPLLGLRNPKPEDAVC